MALPSRHLLIEGGRVGGVCACGAHQQRVPAWYGAGNGSSADDTGATGAIINDEGLRAIMRAGMPVPAPAGKGAIKCTGLGGKVCACIWLQAITVDSAVMLRKWQRMVFLLGIQQPRF